MSVPNRAERRQLDRMAKLAKRGKVPEKPLLTVEPPDELAGHVFMMKRISTPDYIRMRKGEMDDGQLVELIISSVVDHTVDGELIALDPLTLVNTLGDAWVQAHKQGALPQT
jgi:hypothetical protein